MNIVLIGFMGSGKTTIGTKLAEQLGFDFVDTDELVEQQGMLISDIFRCYGETHFRQLEMSTIANLSAVNNCVISVGGGAVMYHNNFEVLKKIGTTVFLDAPLNEIFNRLRGKFRPLVGNTIDEKNLLALHSQRYPTYRQADLVIDTKGLSIQQTVEEIIKRL